MHWESLLSSSMMLTNAVDKLNMAHTLTSNINCTLQTIKWTTIDLTERYLFSLAYSKRCKYLKTCKFNSSTLILRVSVRRTREEYMTKSFNSCYMARKYSATVFNNGAFAVPIRNVVAYRTVACTKAVMFIFLSKGKQLHRSYLHKGMQNVLTN